MELGDKLLVVSVRAVDMQLVGKLPSKIYVRRKTSELLATRDAVSITDTMLILLQLIGSSDGE